MKKIFIAILSAAAILTACESIDSLLDTTNYSAYDTSNFPNTEKDAEQIINSLYYVMTTFYTDPENSVVFKNAIASDDMFGGGSTSNTGAQASDRLLEKGNDESQGSWINIYKAIFRSNFAIEAIKALDEKVFSSADNKNYLLGQAYFFRAWYNWDLAEKYETFPLLTTTATTNNEDAQKRATADAIFKQITDDLLDAIGLMPAKYGYSTDDNRSGRATKYAAEAVLARIWMFYTGFYGKSDMFGVSKSDIINYLKDVRDNSNFGLVDDPREIWPYTNEWSSGFKYDTDFETYASKNGLHWVGNRCKETVWGCHFSLVYSSHGTAGYNRLGEYYGLRNAASSPNTDCYPYGIGYTNGTVNSKMVEEWYKDPDYGPQDKRLFGSVLSVDLSDTQAAYPWLDPQYVELPNHPGNDAKEVERTLFHNKKYMISTCWTDAGKSSILNNFFYAVNSATDNHNQYGNKNDVIYVRYADVLLMLDELEQTVTGMNQLRKRAGLQPYDSYTFERLQKERRYELCFEGPRWTDLRRWYPTEAGKIVAQNQKGAYIQYRGNTVPGGWCDIEGRTIEQRYAITRGFWMISNTEITLSEKLLTQTPGFTENDNWLFANGDLPYPTKY